MISREEYLKALDIVEAYHKQIGLGTIKNSFSKIKDLQETDYVEVVKTDIHTKKSLTIGERYQILRFINKSIDPKFWFVIIDDNGKEKRYRADYGGTFKSVPPNYA